MRVRFARSPWGSTPDGPLKVRTEIRNTRRWSAREHRCTGWGAGIPCNSCHETQGRRVSCRTARSEYFPGLLDVVAVYNVEISHCQVERHCKASGR